MRIKAEQGIEMPRVRSWRSRQPRKLLGIEELQVGESFVVPEDVFKTRGQLSGYLSGIASSRGWKFASRRMDDGSIRVWRLT